MITFKFTPDRRKFLRAQGADSACFAVREFDLRESFEIIRPYSPSWLPDKYAQESIGRVRQFREFRKLIQDPITKHPIVCISSAVTDMRAKFLGLSLMNASIDFLRGRKTGKALPIWHKLFGGYSDVLRDAKERRNYGMIVLSNVAHDSTAMKLEKLRDLLEMYDNSTRVVVINGSDPISFFAEKVRMPLNYAFFLSNVVPETHNTLLEVL